MSDLMCLDRLVKLLHYQDLSQQYNNYHLHLITHFLRALVSNNFINLPIFIGIALIGFILLYQTITLSLIDFFLICSTKCALWQNTTFNHKHNK